MEKTTIFHERIEDVLHDIIVYMTEKGGLAVDACQLGQSIKDRYGDSDIEAWCVVAAQDKDILLVKLIRDLFGGKCTAKEDFERWCRDNDIPFSSDYYI